LLQARRFQPAFTYDDSFRAAAASQAAIFDTLQMIALSEKASFLFHIFAFEATFLSASY